MDKIAKHTKCFRYSSDDMGDKINLLVDGYNWIKKRLGDDYKHDEVMDGMIGENKEKIEDLLA